MNTLNTSLHGGTPIFRAGLITTLGQLRLSDGTPHSPFSSISELTFHILPTGKNLAAERALKCALKGRNQAANIIVFGPRPKPTALRRLLQQGLSAYLLRTATPETIAQAVAAAIRAETYLDPNLKAELLNEQLGLRPTTDILLTRREKQILQLIVEENTTGEIATQLFISPCTVETHRANILGKLGVRNVAGIVREAMRRELCLV